jgi:hypothetical protein
MCLSYAGQLEEALKECDVALTIVPNAPTTLLLHGLLSYRTGLVLQANESFRSCMRQDPDLKDIAELTIAAMMQATGRSEDAIEVASKVLRRSDSVFARIVRGDCYKFHPRGCFGREAAEDYSLALVADPSVSTLLGQGFAPAFARGHLERLLLRFHPWLWRDGPPVLQAYPLMKAGNFQQTVFIGLVFLCVARMRRLVHNGRQRRREAEEKAAYEARHSDLELRMMQLCEAARLSEASFKKNSIAKEAALVNGQVRSARTARPKSAHDYRRVWKERPQGFPLREGLRNSKNLRNPTQGGASKENFAVLDSERGIIDAFLAQDKSRVSAIDPGREIHGLLDSRDSTRYVVDYCAPETSSAVGLLDYAREVRGLPDTIPARQFEPLWERHRDTAHQDLSTKSTFPLEARPLEVDPWSNFPPPQKQLPRGVREFIKGDPHLRGMVKRDGFAT